MRSPDLGVLPDETRFDPAVHAPDRGFLQHDRLIDLAVLERTAVADRRVGTDIGVIHLRAPPDDRRAPNDRVHDVRALLDDDLSFDLAAGDRPAHIALE